MSKRSVLPSLLGQREGGDPLHSLQREIEHVFDDFHRGFHLPAWIRSSENGGGALSPRIDVSETNGDIEVTAELPGVDEEDVDIELVDNTLTIGGEKKFEKEEKGKDFHLTERSYGSFKRSIRLPFDADASKATAKFENGVLTVVLPKPPEAKAKTRKIELKPAS